MSVTRTEILKLYRHLILYSKSLTLTDPAYFRRRVATEFKNNKSLTKPEDISFAYQICFVGPIVKVVHNDGYIVPRGIVPKRKAKHCCNVGLLSNMLLNRVSSLHAGVLSRMCVALKHTIDFSKVPQINEGDLSEQFVRGGGPGGSAVNKNSNCVVLTHVPTGIVVKCHTSRCQDDNRKRAREMLIAKLDEDLNGEHSIAAQKKRLEGNKFKKSEYKKKKMAHLKSEWKKREGLA